MIRDFSFKMESKETSFEPLPNEKHTKNKLPLAFEEGKQLFWIGNHEPQYPVKIPKILETHENSKLKKKNLNLFLDEL